MSMKCIYTSYSHRSNSEHNTWLDIAGDICTTNHTVSMRRSKTLKSSHLEFPVILIKHNDELELLDDSQVAYPLITGLTMTDFQPEMTAEMQRQ